MQVNLGAIGEIYKVRIGHDNSGDFPGWLCDEVRMRDKDTGEELSFPVKRWMSREEDDQEICREIAAHRRGDPNLPGNSLLDTKLYSFEMKKKMKTALH